MFHPSYGLGCLAGGVLLGVYGGQFFTFEIGWIASALLATASIVILTRLRWYGCIVLIILGVMIGILRGSSENVQLANMKKLTGYEVSASGIVVEDPQRTERGDVRLSLSNIHIDGIFYQGQIWASLHSDEMIQRGDKVTVSAKTKEGFGIYQLTMSYAKLISHTPTHDPVVKARRAFGESVRDVVIEPSASLGIGFVTGQKSALPSDFEEQLRVVGLTHVVVASGYNLTILVRFAKRLFEKHSKFLVAATSVGLIVAFMAVSGATPSMVRAGMVAGLGLLAWYDGRRFHPLLLILYVAAITAFANPVYIWADIGWWLSFLAFFGVMIVSPLVLKIIRKNKSEPAGLVTQIIGETTAAQIMTAPLIMIVFGKFAVLSLIANVLSAPFIPLAMLLTVVAGAINMILPVAGWVVGLAAEILLSYFVAVVRFLAEPEWSQIDSSITSGAMLAMYFSIMVWVIVAWRRTKHDFRSQSIVE